MLSWVLGILCDHSEWPRCLRRCTAITEVLDLLLGLLGDAVLEGGVALLLACSCGACKR